MAAYTRADGRRWIARAHQHVRRHRLDAVVHETSQDADAVADTMRAYRTAGFRVEVMALAVAAALSNQGIVARYLEQVRDRGHGRLTVQANADESYTGILALAGLVDGQRLAHWVAVYRRGDAGPRYLNGLDDHGRWQSAPGFAHAVEAERHRPWTDTEAADFSRTQRRLRTELGPDWGPALDRIERQAGPFLARHRDA